MLIGEAGFLQVGHLQQYLILKYMERHGGYKEIFPLLPPRYRLLWKMQRAELNPEVIQDTTHVPYTVNTGPIPAWEFTSMGPMQRV